MGVKLTKVPKLNPEDLTERETLLWQIIRELREKVGELTEVQNLRDIRITLFKNYSSNPITFAFLLARWKTPTGEYLRGKLPEAVVNMGHFGPILKSYLLYQYHHCHVTQPLLGKMMEDWGIDISSGQLNRILVENKEQYHTEKQEILQVGLSVSSYINTDDTGARHKGVNSYCTHIGNEWNAKGLKPHPVRTASTF